MGHLSNVLGSRLGISRRWPMKGISRFHHLCEELSIFFFDLIRKKYNTRVFQRRGILFSHSLVSFLPDRGLNIKVFLYDAHIEELLFRYYMRMRYRRWRLHYRRRKVRLHDFRSLFQFANNVFLRHISPINKNLVRGVKHLRALLFKSFNAPVHRFFMLKILTLLSYRIFKFNVTPHANISFILLSSSNLTARSLANYAIRKLRSKNRLNDIFRPLVNGFSTVTAGFRVLCSGRFTKRQRSSHIKYRAGRTPYSTFTTPIDFCFASVPLKYGVGSMKIWITKRDYYDKIK